MKNLKSWQLQQAKAHFSEVVQEAIAQGPQQITLRGEPVVFLISKADYDKLKKPKHSFIEFMRKSPMAGITLKIKRNVTKTRDVDL